MLSFIQQIFIEHQHMPDTVINAKEMMVRKQSIANSWNA